MLLPASAPRLLVRTIRMSIFLPLHNPVSLSSSSTPLNSVLPCSSRPPFHTCAPSLLSLETNYFTKATEICRRQQSALRWRRSCSPTASTPASPAFKTTGTSSTPSLLTWTPPSASARVRPATISALQAAVSFLSPPSTPLRHSLSVLAPPSPSLHKRQKGMTSEPEFQEENKSAKPKTLGTHNGTFHCDEALGCFLLRMTKKYKGADIIRTRDQKVLDSLDAVIDVGGVYDADKDRFDHHQRGFDHVFGRGFNTKLSSAGLVYKHFGRDIIADIMGLPVEHKDVDTVFVAVYKNFIEAVDAIDNGVNQYATDSPPLYQNNTHLAARVARLNPDWLEEQSQEKENARFLDAVALTGDEFLESVKNISKSWLPARTIVAECLANAPKVHPSGEIVLLSQFCPWKQHLAELESDLEIPLERLPKYVVYEDERSHQWRVQAVSVSPGSFQSRLPLPDSWRGLRDEELSEVAGIPRCVFVHSSGFIGGNVTKEGAVLMAKKALGGRQCAGQV